MQEPEFRVSGLIVGRVPGCPPGGCQRLLAAHHQPGAVHSEIRFR